MANMKMTLEEKLEEAVVKDVPYEVPEKWLWSKLGKICNKIQYGYTEKASSEKIGPHFLRITDIQDNYVEWRNVPYCSITDKDYSKYKIESGDIVIARTGATTGKNYIISEEIDSVFASYLIRVQLDKKICNRYISYYMNSDLYWNQIIEQRKGIAQPGVNAQKLGELMLPIPPLKEQQRIVDRIESLFEKLDKAKALIEEAREDFKNRKSAILEKAFRGELYKVNYEKCNNTSIGEISNLVTKGSSPRWQGIEYVEDMTQTLFITSENVREGHLDLTKQKYLQNEFNAKQKRSILQKGDILLNIVGASIGRACIYNLDKIANINQAVALIRLDEQIVGEFISYYLNSPFAKQYYINNKVDVARANLSLKDVANIPVILPAIEEQKEIVRILDKLLEEESKIEEFTQLEEQIELIKKSILAKAFRGQLGTNCEEDESALELLKEMLNK